MFSTCRAGRNAWLPLSRSARRSHQTITTTKETRVITTTTTTTTTTTVTPPPGPHDGSEVPQLDIKAHPSSGTPSTPSSLPSDSAYSVPTGNGGRQTAEGPAEGVDGEANGRKVIFSGIQPTGVPHLGNYLGALREWKRLQDTAHTRTQLYFCIVDLHALTVPRPREELLQNKQQMMAALLAVGLGSKRSHIYFQSTVKAHAEMQWILSCTASMGYLSRMTQWKSKMQLDAKASLDDPKARKALKHGLFSYPILQAADILVHRATHVPVGEDQRQHLEFARECVTNFNHTYKTDILVPPQTIVSPARRIMSLTNPLQKMSKSDPSPRSRILITDSPEDIAKKIQHAVTDSLDTVTYDPKNRPGVSNLIDILSGFDPQGRTPAQLAEQMAGHKIGELKQVVAQVVASELAEVRDSYHLYMSKPSLCTTALNESITAAGGSTGSTLAQVKRAIGLESPL